MNKTNGPTQSQQKKKKKRKNQVGRNILIVIQVLVVLFLMGAVAAGAAAFGFVASIVKEQNVLTYEEMVDIIYTNSLTGFAYFHDGQPIGKLPAEQDRRLVDKDDFSPYIIDALISIEDKRFYDHHGVSFKSTMRAVLQQVTDDETKTGGSTITQQLVKNTLLEDMFNAELQASRKNEDTTKLKYNRKMNEIFLALRLERYFSKDQILEAYFNEVYFGKGANGSNLYGIQAASKGIFGKDVKDLNLAQSAYIVGIVQSPGNYNPFQDKGLENGLARMERVLNEMKEDGKITERQFDEAVKFDIKGSLVKASELEDAYEQYPFLVNEALDRAAEVLVEQDLRYQGLTRRDLTNAEYSDQFYSKRREILRNGYRIYTTVHKNLYEAFQAFGANPDNFWANQTYTTTIAGEKVTIEDAPQQVGAVLMDNRTGAIIASLAGRDFKIEQTDHTRAPRQPGSAMKPILAYGPAIEEGVLLSPESPLDDSPIVLNYGKTNEHTPVNWNGGYQGIMTAREALRQSWNIPAVKTYLNVGIPTALDYAERMGITTLAESDQHAQTGVIGGLAYGTTVEELTNAFATFPNNGNFVKSYMIERIENNQGEVIYQHQGTSQTVMSPQSSYLVTDMLKTVYHNGTGNTVKQHFVKDNPELAKVDIAGKTGTTNSEYDVWFIGYTPHISLGVWTGFDHNYSQKGDANRAKFVWAKLMKFVYEMEPDLSPIEDKFERPDGLVTLEICSKSGLLPSELCREAGHVISGTFKKENVPTETDDSHVKARAVVIDEKMYLAHDYTPDDMVISKVFIKTDPLQFPTKTNKSLRTFLPKDWMDRLPTEVDMREDDGYPPSTPTGIQLSHDSGTGHTTITWTPNPEGDIAGYRIYRIKYYGTHLVASKLNHEAKEYVDIDGDYNTGYYIVAVDIAGNESMPSQVYSLGGGTQEWAGSEPSTPTGMYAVSGVITTDLIWNENPEKEQVEKYNIYYSDSKDGPYEFLASNSIAFYQHLTFSGHAGWYKVSAENHYGESPLSAPFTVNSNSGNGNGGQPSDQPPQDEEDDDDEDGSN